MLTASGLAKSFGSRQLFANVTMHLTSGRRVGLVGGNGIGKTTLLEILMGLTEAGAGEVHRPKDLRIGYLPQELTEASDRTVLDEVLDGAGELAALGRRVIELAAALADTGAAEADRVLAEYGDAQTRFEQHGGFALEAEAHRILAGLGFVTGDADRPVREFSGGWRMRIALARLLLAEPDLLVLDEPTNHLDVDSVAWLEQQLAEWAGALLFVSHDRDFIDAVANRIVELSADGAFEYVGSFADYVIAREDRLAQVEAAAASQARRVAHIEQFVDRFRYKATKARQVQSRLKMLGRLDRLEPPSRKEVVARFGFPEPQRSSREVVELDGVAVGYDGDTVLSDVSMVIERGRKVALVGPNGAGKTTLVRLLQGQLQPTTGTARIGANVDTAFFAQDQAESLEPGRTVLEEFKTVLGTAHLGINPRSLLGSFGFTGDAVDRLVVDLSGGERTRLALAKTMASPVNLLVLDEPTNHLDLPSCDMLEDALRAYPGTVLLVTHDRHLIRSVADALIEVRGGAARWHDGVDEAVLTPGAGASSPKPAPARSGESPAAQDSTAQDSTAPVRRRKASTVQRRQDGRDLSRSQRKLERVERLWEEAEAEVVRVQEQLGDPALYGPDAAPGAAEELAATHSELKDRAAELMTQWERIASEVEAGAGR